jgi:tRNA G18 (ribose-2'-O)-methylase SpoU
MTVDNNSPVENSTNVDNRNVSDEFKHMSAEMIRMSMQSRRVPAVNVAMNLTHDFNKASIVRANEAFAFKEIIFVNRVNEQNLDSAEGVKHYNRRGTVGMHHYANMRHVVDWRGLFGEYHADGYTIFAVDNTPEFNPQPVYNVLFPEKSVFVYGEETLGLSRDMVEACDEVVYIPQFGVVRSLNVAQAAAVVMFEYSRQHRPVLD